MIKLVAIDLDGTLLDSNSEISEVNRKAVQRISNEGAQVVIATGRGQFSVLEIFRELGVDGYLIGYNGAQISRIEQGTARLLASRSLDQPIIAAGFQQALKHQITLVASNLGYSYRFVQAEQHQVIQEFQSTRPDLVRVSVEEMRKIAQDTDYSILKMAFTDLRKEKLLKVQAELAQGGIHAFFSDDNYIEVVADGVSKGAALEQLSESLGIERKETMAFGDQENDLELLKHAGVGVAMGNAMMKVRQAADVVAESNDDSGVGKMIAKYFHF